MEENGKFKSFVFGLIAIFMFFCPIDVEAQRVVVAQGIDAEALDPSFGNSLAAQSIQGNLYDTLISRDKNMKLIYRLATSVKNMSPTKWRLTLRKGVTFHNGEPFNAESVKFSFDRVLGDAKSRIRGWIATVEKVEIIDDYTVDIITKAPDPGLRERIVFFNMVPQKYIKEVGDVNFNLNPVGTGPFKFVKWVRGDQIIFEKYENYWEGAPQVKELVFRAIPETQARLAGLQTGEVDIAVNIPGDLIESLKGKGNFEFKQFLTNRMIFLQLSGIQEGPLINKKVRQAINYAIDKDSIIKTILSGHGKKSATLLPEIVFGHDSSLKPYPYDPKKAKQLLAEAGYPNGFEISIDSPSGRYMRDKEVCQAIVGQLEKVGIKAKIQVFEWATYLNRVLSHKQSPIYLFAWSQTSLDPDAYLWNIFRSGQVTSQTDDKELDKLLDEAKSEMDSAKRQKLYEEIQKIAYDRAYLVILYQQIENMGVSKRIDFMPRSDEMIVMREVRIRE